MVQLKLYKKRKIAASEILEGCGAFESFKYGYNIKTKLAIA